MKTIVALCLFFAAFLPLAAQADQSSTLFSRRCSYYRSPRDFVQKASLLCIAKSHTKDCVDDAKKYFRECNFRGDYERLSSEVHTGMLFMLVLAGAPEVSRLRRES